MEPADELTTDNESFCFAKKDKVYAVYLPTKRETTSLDIGDSEKEFRVQWFNPRKGGKLEYGSISTITAKGIVELGLPPADGQKDWVVLVREIAGKE